MKRDHLGHLRAQKQDFAQKLLRNVNLVTILAAVRASLHFITHVLEVQPRQRADTVSTFAGAAQHTSFPPREQDQTHADREAHVLKSLKKCFQSRKSVGIPSIF